MFGIPNVLGNFFVIVIVLDFRIANYLQVCILFSRRKRLLLTNQTSVIIVKLVQ
jgi:hypothetical protein